MDSRDSSALPSYHLHHHPQPPPPAVFLGQHIHHHPNNSYPLHSGSVSVAPSTSAAMTLGGHQQQNPGFPFNSMASVSVPKQLDHHYSDGSPSGGGGGGFSIEPVKKKRGRPRKYSPDNSIGLGLSSAPVNQISSTAGHANSSSGAGGETHSSETAAKRIRGRPPGSVKKQLNALGSPGVGFTPHVIIVAVGEDIASKIMEFSQQGSRTVCILSAYGSISNVTLRQPAMSGGTVTYEGRFEIISLSGSFLVSEISDNHNRTGGLSVSLAGYDGRVLGGGVVGILKAASSVQVVVGSFIAHSKKSKSGLSSSPTSKLNFGTPVAGVSRPSPGASSESAEENDYSPLNHGPEPYGNASQPMQNMPMYSSMGWPNNIKMHSHPI